MFFVTNLERKKEDQHSKLMSLILFIIEFLIEFSCNFIIKVVWMKWSYSPLTSRSSNKYRNPKIFCIMMCVNYIMCCVQCFSLVIINVFYFVLVSELNWIELNWIGCMHVLLWKVFSFFVQFFLFCCTSFYWNKCFYYNTSPSNYYKRST
jgi:hypothetical protein